MYKILILQVKRRLGVHTSQEVRLQQERGAKRGLVKGCLTGGTMVVDAFKKRKRDGNVEKAQQ